MLSADRVTRRTERRSQVDARAADVGAAQVVDGDRVGAAEHAEIHGLDVVRVGGGRVAARDADPRATGRCSQPVVARRAHHHEPVAARVALHAIAAVVGIGAQHVVARAEHGRVVARAGVDAVVAGAAVQAFHARAARELVVARVALERRLLSVGEDAARVVDAQHVVAVATADDDLVEPAAGKAELSPAAAPGVDLERPARPALEAQRDRVAPPVAGDRQRLLRDLGPNGRRLALLGLGRLGIDGGEGEQAGQQGERGQEGGARIQGGSASEQ